MTTGMKNMTRAKRLIRVSRSRRSASSSPKRFWKIATRTA